MAKKSLRAQLNQIRAWVRQGRTDAWIAHQLEVPASELREFRRRHELTADGDDDAELDLRDEIEAEIEAASLEEDDEEDEDTTTTDSEEDDRDSGPDSDADAKDADAEERPQGEPRRRRRRGRRGRGGRGGGPKKLEATFDHGEEGYGLWLDPAVTDDSTYSEHWAGHRAVVVEI